jgi:hypothetical protein
MVFGRNMDRAQMAAPVESGKHDGIESIGLAVVVRLARDKRRGNHFAGEAVAGKNPLEHEACTGGFVATARTGP